MPVIKLANEAHIYERITPDHRLTGYQVKIRRVGYPPYPKAFDDLKEARIAVNRVLADQSRGLRINPLLAERSTLADVIKSAIKELENGTRVVKGKTAVLCRLRGFLKREQALCAHAMSLLTDTMMEDWREGGCLPFQQPCGLSRHRPRDHSGGCDIPLFRPCVVWIMVSGAHHRGNSDAL